MSSFRNASKALLSVVVVSACGAPVIYDASLQPVRNPLIVASVDNGRLAVDSTEAGIRAVLELQLDGPGAADEFVQLHVPKLHCTVSGEHIPSKVLREEPKCASRPIMTVSCPTGFTPEECDAYRQQETELCTYTIRAEFLFAEMPHLDENTHFFTFSRTDSPVYWTRAERDR